MTSLAGHFLTKLNRLAGDGIVHNLNYRSHGKLLTAVTLSVASTQALNTIPMSSLLTEENLPNLPQVKAYSKPPPLVETVMAAVMTLMGRGSDWATAKKALGEGNFLTQVRMHLNLKLTPRKERLLSPYQTWRCIILSTSSIRTVVCFR